MPKTNLYMPRKIISGKKYHHQALVDVGRSGSKFMVFNNYSFLITVLATSVFLPPLYRKSHRSPPSARV